jgi:hypothetical protein
MPTFKFTKAGPVPTFSFFYNTPAGLKVFGNMRYNPDNDYNRHNNFQTFADGLFVLFR